MNLCIYLHSSDRICSVWSKLHSWNWTYYSKYRENKMYNSHLEKQKLTTGAQRMQLKYAFNFWFLSSGATGFQWRQMSLSNMFMYAQLHSGMIKEVWPNEQINDVFFFFRKNKTSYRSRCCFWCRSRSKHTHDYLSKNEWPFFFFFFFWNAATHSVDRFARACLCVCVMFDFFEESFFFISNKQFAHYITSDTNEHFMFHIHIFYCCIPCRNENLLAKCVRMFELFIRECESRREVNVWLKTM